MRAWGGREVGGDGDEPYSRTEVMTLSCLVLSCLGEAHGAWLICLLFSSLTSLKHGALVHGKALPHITSHTKLAIYLSTLFLTLLCASTKYYIPKLRSFSSSTTDTTDDANETTIHEAEAKPNRQGPPSPRTRTRTQTQTPGPKHPHTRPASRSRTYRIVGKHSRRVRNVVRCATHILGAAGRL